MISNLRKVHAVRHIAPVAKYLSNQPSKSGTKTQDEDLKCTEDVYGPPDPKSNLRLINFFVPVDETPAEKDYRLKRAKVQEWNQQFWSAHNQQFLQAKEEFITNLGEERKKSLKGDSTITPDELSVFYKQFLNENRPKHLQYNTEWHRKNLRLLWPGIKAYVSRLRKGWYNS